MRLTDEQIDARLSVIESMIAGTNDTKALPGLNRTYQTLLDEQVRRDMEQTDGQTDN